MKSKIIGAALAVLLVASSATAAEPTDPGETPEVLDPIEITGQPDPLDLPMLRLRALLDASAPCLGCDAATVPTSENKVLGLVRFLLLPAIPPPRDETSRAMSYVRCSQAGPGMDYLCP